MTDYEKRIFLEVISELQNEILELLNMIVEKKENDAVSVHLMNIIIEIKLIKQKLSNEKLSNLCN